MSNIIFYISLKKFVDFKKNFLLNLLTDEHR